MPKKNESTTYVLTQPGDSIFLTGQGGTLIRVDFLDRTMGGRFPTATPEVKIEVGAEPAKVRTK